jgi:hypothetical protein
MMHGWRITGKWTGGGESAEETFTLLTRTREQEEVRCRALQELVSRPFRPHPELTGEVTVELVDAVELDPIVPLPENVRML